MNVNREPLADFYAFVRWPCVQSEVSLLRQLGMLIAIWAKLHRSLWCAEMLIALRGSEDHALKADRSLIDPIMKLKSGLPQNLRVFARKPVWFTDWYKSYASDNVYPFDVDQKVAWYLAVLKHLIRSGTRHLFSKLIIFADGLESPFDLCYKVRRP
jgi:hypothetical protein